MYQKIFPFSLRAGISLFIFEVLSTPKDNHSKRARPLLSGEGSYIEPISLRCIALSADRPKGDRLGAFVLGREAPAERIAFL